MVKTVKYDMSINTITTSGKPIPLSQKEFLRQLKHYKDVIAKNHDSHKEEIEELKELHPSDWRYSEIENCLDDIDVHTEDYEKYTETTYAIHDDGAIIVFGKRVCKPGYHWK